LRAVNYVLVTDRSPRWEEGDRLDCVIVRCAWPATTDADWFSGITAKQRRDQNTSQIINAFHLKYPFIAGSRADWLSGENRFRSRVIAAVWFGRRTSKDKIDLLGRAVSVTPRRLSALLYCPSITTVKWMFDL